MIDFGRIDQAETWRNQLGLLPVPLHAGVSNDEFVLLNGQSGNFCFAINSDQSEDYFKKCAWSSNVNCFVNIRKDELSVHWWQRGLGFESYPIKEIAPYLPEFQSYLEEKRDQSARSVIRHVIETYRSFCAASPEQIDSHKLLQGFLVLMACASSDTSLVGVDKAKWRLSENGLEVADAIPQGTWLSLIDQLATDEDRLQVDFNLLLRHAAGSLFQEAHYETEMRAQLPLSGMVPAPARMLEKTSSVGVYFTPPMIARTLVEEAFYGLTSNSALPGEIQIFDPACGSGEFLREAIRQAEILGFDGRLRLVGWDLSQTAIEMSNFVLGWEVDHTNIQIDLELDCRNALDDSEWPTSDIITMNPPFVSWTDMNRTDREVVKSVLGGLAKGRADMAQAFVWRAANSLACDGVLASVVPASVLDGSSFQNARKQLQALLDLQVVGRLGSQELFARARVDAGVIVAQRCARNNANSTDSFYAIWADQKRNSASKALRGLRKSSLKPVNQRSPKEIGSGYSVYISSIDTNSENSWAIRPYQAVKLFERTQHLPRVGDLFDVRQGARTGNNSVFILSSSIFHELPEQEQEYFRPAIVNSSIDDSRVRNDSYVFFPYGHDRTISTESELRRRVGTYYRTRLLPSKERLQARAGIDEDAWWLLTRPRSWQTDAFPKIVSSYFGTSGSFAWDSEGQHICVQAFAWVPKSRISLTNSLPDEVGYAYVALLNARLVDTLLSSISNHIGGGQWNLSKAFVQNLPVPELTSSSEDPQLVRDLAEVGRLLSKGAEVNHDEIEELARRAYREG